MAALKGLLKRAFLSAFSARFSAERDETRMDTPNNRFSEVKLTSILGPFESYVVTAQSILIWERPMASLVLLVLVNAIFWLAVSSDIKFYFVIAAGMAVVHVYRTWTNQIWPEIRVPLPEGEDNEETTSKQRQQSVQLESQTFRLKGHYPSSVFELRWTPVNPQVFSVPEISRYLGQMSDKAMQWTDWLMKTRQKQPGMFCVLTSCILAVTALLGCYISGIFQAYFTLMAIILGPGFFVHVYPMFSDFLSSEAGPNLDRMRIDDDDDDDEASRAAIGPLRALYGVVEDQELEQFLPEENQETMELLTRAVEPPSNRDSASSSSVMASQEFGLGLDFSGVPDEDDGLVSLQAGLLDLPSYDQVDSDNDQEDFIDGNGSIPATIPPPSSSRRQSESPEIRFVPSYFDDDSEDAGMTLPPIRRIPGNLRSTTSPPNDHQESLPSSAAPLTAEATAASATTETTTTTEAPEPVSRQSSTTPSEVEGSDYEFLSESELS